jgi:hypothetical protein
MPRICEIFYLNQTNYHLLKLMVEVPKGGRLREFSVFSPFSFIQHTLHQTQHYIMIFYEENTLISLKTDTSFALAPN